MTEDNKQPDSNHDNESLKSPKWKISPILEPIITSPPELGIGKRIAFCRGQLDNLSVDALARLTKSYDEDGAGVSRQSILRYESGSSSPGAREIRILSQALNASPTWLIFGELESSEIEEAGKSLLLALSGYVRKASAGGQFFDDWDEKIKKSMDRERSKLIDAARKPQPRD